MADLSDLLQSADWKLEKHVPVIEAPDVVKKGEPFKVAVTVGKSVPHPNTTEHHIRWITVFFLADQEKFPYQIARVEFDAHGESAQGPNMSTIYASSEASVTMKTDKAGTIFASSYCNIHGLWKGLRKVALG